MGALQTSSLVNDTSIHSQAGVYSNYFRCRKTINNFFQFWTECGSFLREIFNYKFKTIWKLIGEVFPTSRSFFVLEIFYFRKFLLISGILSGFDCCSEGNSRDLLACDGIDKIRELFVVKFNDLSKQAWKVAEECLKLDGTIVWSRASRLPSWRQQFSTFASLLSAMPALSISFLPKREKFSFSFRRESPKGSTRRLCHRQPPPSHHPPSTQPTSFILSRAVWNSQFPRRRRLHSNSLSVHSTRFLDEKSCAESHTVLGRAMK